MAERLDLGSHSQDMAAATKRPAMAAEVEPSVGPKRLHRIVVVGGGAAGLELVTRLGDRLGRRGRAQIALVDCARAHLWKPLLHEVAAGSLDLGEHELSYLAQAHWHHFRYLFGEMVGLDRARKEVRLAATFDDEGREITPPRAVGYDTLVIAIGSVTNDFGTPGVVEHAVPLETPTQAARFNQRLVNACLRAQTQPGPVRPGQLHVAIVGAGATGTELCRRAASHHARSGRLRIRPHRSRARHPHHADRGHGSRPARPAGADLERDAPPARQDGHRRSYRR